MVFDINTCSSSLDTGYPIRLIPAILDPKDGFHHLKRVSAHQPNCHLHHAAEVLVGHDRQILRGNWPSDLLRAGQFHVPEANE